MEQLPQLPPKKDRVKGQQYIKNDTIVTWNGARLNCQHNRRKQYCNNCMNKKPIEKKTCIHLLVKSLCTKCKGGSICIHNKRKSNCKKCGGSQICKHSKLRSQCRECGGSAFCIHDIRKSQCIDCGGTEVCQHNKRRHRCKECNKQCPHKLSLHSCNECNPLCKSPWCESRVTSKEYKGYCLGCYIIIGT